MDPNFAWLYQYPPAEISPTTTLLVTDKVLSTNKLQESNQQIIDHQVFGAMDAYILKAN